MKKTLVTAVAFMAALAYAHAQYVPMGPKQLLSALPKPAEWKMTQSAASTTYLENLTTVANRSFERTIEVDGEEMEYFIDLTVVDTGGDAPSLTELREMPESKEPDFIVTKKQGQTLMIMLDESGMNLYRTDLYKRFVVTVDTNVPREQAMKFVSSATYPGLRNAPTQRLPENLRAFRAINYNELDESKNVVFEEEIETMQDVEDELNAIAASLGIKTAAEEDEEAQKDLAESGELDETGDGETGVKPPAEPEQPAEPEENE